MVHSHRFTTKEPLHAILKRIEANNSEIWNKAYGFEAKGVYITCFTLDESYMEEVDPVDYYGAKNIENLVKEWEMDN
jgi:hypothetical protein